jgi:hypothetical protein
MQIHEITKTQLDEGVGSFLGGLAGGVSNFANKVTGAISPVGPAKNAFTSAVRPQQIKMLADKVYNGWKQYEKTLLQSNPDARETPMYEQALTAFVVKNLLGNQYLPNIINQEQIKKLIKQLSGSSGITEADASKVTGAANSGRPTAAEQEKFQKMAAAAASAAPKTPGTPPPETPTPPKTPTAPAAPLTPQKEKDLWLQLTQQAAVATAHAPGTGGGSKPSDPKNPNDPSAGDARTIEQTLKKALDPAMVNGLAAFLQASNSGGHNPNLKSTGNPVADAMLLMAGFQGL